MDLIIFSIFVPITFTAFAFFADRLTDIVPFVGWVDTPIWIALTIGVWLVWFSGVSVLIFIDSVVNNPIQAFLLMLFVGGVSYAYITNKKQIKKLFRR